MYISVTTVSILAAPTYFVSQWIYENEVMRFLATGTVIGDIVVGVIGSFTLLLVTLVNSECVLAIIMHVDFGMRSFQIMKS